MNKNDLFFRPTVTEVDCIPLDDDLPVLMEFSPIGELVMHNWDDEADEAMAALGDTSLCLSCSDPLAWRNDVLDAIDYGESHNREYSIPWPMIEEGWRVGKLLKGIIEKSKKKTFLGRFKVLFFVKIHGLRESGTETIKRTAYPYEKRIEATAKKRAHMRTGKRKAIEMDTTVEALANMLSIIPNGLLFVPEEKYWTLAISISSMSEDVEEFVVEAARRVRNPDGRFDLTTATAVVAPTGSRWDVVEWL